MSEVNEIGPGIFRISTFMPPINMAFCQFVVRDDEPLLYHTGMRGLFPDVREAVSKVLDPATIRWIGFSHFEADECGALREWQGVAPDATPVCSFVAKFVSVDDVVAARPCRALADGEVLATGACRFRFLQTPHVPHAWDAGHLFEEASGTLLCSDLLHQMGDLEPVTEADVVGRFRETLAEFQKGPFANYLPYTRQTRSTLERLAALEPKVLAPMHGSAFAGDGGQALLDVADVIRDALAGPDVTT